MSGERQPSARRGVRFAATGLLAAGLIAASGTACGSGTAAEGQSAMGKKEVVLVTYDGYALPKAAAAAFRRSTGYTVRVSSSGDSGAMLSRALLSAGAPEGDVIFGIDNLSAAKAVTGKLLDPGVTAAASISPEFVLDGSGASRLVPIDHGDVCVNVDSKWFAEHGVAPPATLEDLTAPTYKDLLVVESPVTSSPGLALLAGTVGRYGERGAFDFWTRLKHNGVRVRPSWDDAYFTDYTVAGGDRPLVLSYATSPPAEVVLSEGKRTEPQSTVLADSCSSQVEYAGILRGAPHAAAAKRLLAFLQDPQWQRELPLSNYVLPVVAGTPVPAEFQKWAATSPHPMGVTSTQAGERRDQWIEQWRNIFE